MGDPVADKNSAIISHFLSGAATEKYQGKQVVVIGGQAHPLPEDPCEAASIMAELARQYPDEILHCVSVPRSHPV